MTEKLYPMRIERVPHSSVVGSSLKIVADGVGVVALLMISVPQPHLDYKTVADAVATAILNGHVSSKGVTLILPDNFKEAATEVLNACNHDFQGWREFADGNGGEQVCTKCGRGAMAYTLRTGP